MAEPGEHDEVPLKPVVSHVVEQWPAGTFLENIAVLPNGDFVISAHNRQQLHRASVRGGSSLLATLPVSPAGLIAAGDLIHVVAGEPGVGPHRLFAVGADGRVEERLAVPDSLFLNGFTPGRSGKAYTVDSIRGVVIEIDLNTATSRVVLRDERLTKCSEEPMLPGANGIKAGDDVLWITNTDRALVLRVELGEDGPTGRIDTFAERLRGDDLAVGAAGELYITNHIHNTLIRLRPNGERVAIAGPDEGMVGCTACVFGGTPETANDLFVTTTGGIVMPLGGVVREAKLVRLGVSVPGRPVAFLS